MRDSILEVAGALRATRYADAAAIFAAGSLVRGEGTSSSDLDLVVVYTHLPRAYRESFRHGGYPVEALVHDPATLEYFFLEIDRPSGVPALMQMITEGVEIPGPTERSRDLKERAAALLKAGPPVLDDETERRMRYSVSDLLDDLRAPRSRVELVGAGARLYEQLADYHLRRQGLWSARGKAIPRVLQGLDEALRDRYCGAFGELFERGDPQAVIELGEDLLKDVGGPLFDGYRADAPATWRREPGTAV